ncbi:MAG: T9SS type A sorting domain-containing protein, partial [Bacteroidota bacterium]
QVLLLWQTIHESNTHFFSVERKHETSTHFEEIGILAASGTSAGVETYEFIDGKALRGRNTYRIRLTDLDGSFDYSGSRELWIGGNLGENSFSHHPQPAKGVLSLIWESGERSKVYVKVLNLQGKILIKDQRLADPGANSWELDISSLAGGYYLLELMENGRSLGVRSLVKE